MLASTALGVGSSHARMTLDDYPEYLSLVERAVERMAGEAEVRLGMECDFYPGIEPWLEEQFVHC